MTTPKEMAKFCEQLPDDTIVVLVAQRGRHPTALRTDSLDLPIIYPNWPKACWQGISDAVNGEPLEPEDEEGQGNGSTPGEPA